MRNYLAKALKIRLSLKRPPAGPGTLRTRLTPSGWGFLGLVLCGFLMSVNFSNNLIFAMTALLVSIALVGWYHTRVNVAALAGADWHGAAVFAGQQALYRLTLENARPYGRHGLRAAAAGAPEQQETGLPQGGQGELTLKLPAGARGVIRPAPAEIRSSFPLGIFEARLATGLLPETLVYPRPAGDQPIPARALGRQAHLQSEAGTFAELRRYAPGDPPSRIFWKGFARFDELYTKEFDGAQGEAALWLRWDEVRENAPELRLSQLCRWVIEAHHQNREYGLELPGISIEPAGEEAQLRRCLQALALYGIAERQS